MNGISTSKEMNMTKITNKYGKIKPLSRDLFVPEKHRTGV